MKCDELKVHKAYNRWIDEEMHTPNDDLICNEVYLKDEVDAAIAELKQIIAEKESWVKMLGKGQKTLSLELEKTKKKLEGAKATAYAESVDAGMRERRLKRALWLARAERARDKAKMFWNRWEDVNFRKWQKVKRKCLKKAEEYK